MIICTPRSEAGFAIVRLIHGRGKGVQRAAVQRLLRTHPLVDEFWDAPEAHLGATVVRLEAAASVGPTSARAIAVICMMQIASRAGTTPARRC